MGYTTHRQMSLVTLGAGLPKLERAALLDMALAVEDGSLIYAWGHERLAVALDKEPGTKAAKRALERVLSSLIGKGMIVRTSRAHRGHNAEYRLAVLEGNGPRSERGPIVSASVENGPRSEAEWAPVLDRMGPGLGGAPLPTHYQSTDVLKPPSRGRREDGPASPRQMAFIADLTRALDYEFPSVESRDHAYDLIREYWHEMERRRAAGEPLDGSITDLSPAGQRYARRHGLTFTTREEGAR